MAQYSIIPLFIGTVLLCANSILSVVMPGLLLAQIEFLVQLHTCPLYWQPVIPVVVASSIGTSRPYP